eukprot:18081-Heterococcus_DN1.PRE.1
MRISRAAALLRYAAAAVLVHGAVDYQQSLLLTPTLRSYNMSSLVRLQLGDDQTVQLNLTQPFGFFPREQSAYTKINICSNGWVSFFDGYVVRT